ncbi:FAD-dependent oxidoreductase [Nocardia takedensis]|uniref:FAD-dependent oxidoreductase n=1 Tax=Nocardia takedensis TaxID=259390 RepID=UPI0006856E74|nr:FAD-dependent oxidoreductase [Nocardia takedensis]
MKKRIDCVVIGGGVAGLMTAARLAGAGMSVRLIERDLLGAGATTSNHGLVHSGALYARWHPEIVTTCALAQITYRTAFPDCVVATQPCWYYGTPETMHTYRQLWRRHDIVNRGVGSREISELLRVHGRDVAASEISELVIDTRALLNRLAAHCVSSGVEIAVGVEAARIVTEDRRVCGVATAHGSMSTPTVVVCAGIGTRALLDDAGSMIGTLLSSRLEMLTAYPGALPRPMIGLEFGWPALAPTASGVVLASRYGGAQPTVTKAGRNSGSTALEIIFSWLDVTGRTVLVPTNTNYATAAAALRAGARVELYDSGLYPDLDDIAMRLTGSVAAVVVVHIGGYLSPRLPELVTMCERAGVALVEDAAHAHGAHLHGIPAGGFGVAAAWSFFATKVVTTGGKGGAITTNDNTLAAFARRFRNQGKDSVGVHILAGNSWRLTEIGAVLGAIGLDQLTADTRTRRAIIDRYQHTLDGPASMFPDIGDNTQVSGHKCVALLADGVDRDSVRAASAEHGVTLARGVYEQPLHRQPVFADLNVDDRFGRAEDFATRHICLPLWRSMDAATVEKVITAVAAATAAAR